MDRDRNWILDTAYGIVPKHGVDIDLKFLLGILNSRILTYFLKATGTPLRGGYFRLKTAYLRPFPVPSVDKPNDNLKSVRASIVDLVQQMLDLHKHLPEVKTDHDRNVIQRQIDATDREIDQSVYELYGLTDKEIALVEEATGE